MFYASVNSNCALRPPPPPPPLRAYCGAFACLVSPGGGVFANFVLPGGRALANLGAIPEVGKHARGLLSKYYYTEDFSGKESRLTHLSRKKLKRVVKVCVFTELHSEIGSYRRESTFLGY